jgi:heme a synthase
MKGFQRIVLISIIGTYLVIFAGAIVRGTGSGLGCPDWPRCFGQWIPPTDITELPENYKEIYKIAGKTIADFDPFKTWTEYINRLLGALLGLIITILFIWSFKLRYLERNLTWFCSGLLFLIIIQGGVGALVVSTHLKPFLITIHMFLAIILLFGLLYLRKYCLDLQDTSIVAGIDEKALTYSKVLIALSFFQVLLGTQVRQQVDHFTRDTGIATPETIMEHMGSIFYIHRSFSIVIVALLIYLIYYFHRKNYNRAGFFYSLMSLFCVAGNIFTGITLNYFSFPAHYQPPHLLFGIMTVSLLYMMSLELKGTLLGD